MKTHESVPFPDELASEPDRHELERVWSALDAAAMGSGVSAETTDAAWTELAGRIAAPAPVALPTPGARASARSFPLFRAAAAVAALALGVAAVRQAVPVSVTAPVAQQVAVSLPDGSSVELNAGSTVRYRRGFARLPGVPAALRTVRLQGEAFFEVATDGRPFEVVTRDARVRVLGTRFNVRSREGSTDGTRVMVEEGVVALVGYDEDGSGDAGVVLAASETGRVDAVGRAGRADSVEPGRIGAWRRGGLTVVDEPLSDLLQELGLRFGVTVSLRAPGSESVRLNVYYPELTDIESVLGDLSTMQGLQYRRTADGWEISSP